MRRADFKVIKAGAFHRPLFKRKSGFTLIEVAIVLVIIGMLMAVGISLLGPLTKRTKRIDSREAVKAAKEAILGFAVKNKRLPTTTEFPAIVKSTDAWGNALFYYPDANLTSGNACCSSSTGFQVEEECPAGQGCATSHSCCKSETAFILLSMGENGTNNTGTVAIFTILEQSDTYDDITAYVSISEIKNNVLACEGLEITTSTLLDAQEDSFYNAQLIGKGACSPIWAVSGQTINTQGCAGNSFPLTNPNTSDLCLYEATGVISGAVNVAAGSNGTLSACSNTFNFTATAAATGMAAVNKDFSITVNPQTLRITTTTLFDAKTGVNYNKTINGAGGKNSYTWSVVGQVSGTFGCAAGNYPITDSNIGLCLNSSTGVLSGSPNAAATYNFTASLADGCATTSTAYTLNVIDSCFITGINIRNSTGAQRGYIRNGGACNAWVANTNLNVQPVDVMQFYSNAGCATLQCTVSHPTLNYGTFQGIDNDDDCSISWTVANNNNCTFADL